MTENAENLILEHLKRFQSSQERIERGLREVKTRLSHLEVGQGNVIRLLGDLASADAAAQLGIDRLRDRVERIERRLDLTH